MTLFYQAFGLGRGKGRVFIEDARGVASAAFDLPAPGAAPEALAEALLTPVASALDGARRVRVLATGPLLGVDFHALPFRGQPLVARASVVYPVDLPPRAEEAIGARAAALIVSDARSDLPASRREGAEVAAKIKPSFAVSSLDGDAGTKPAVLRALAGSSLFHFGGHGTFAGWSSALALADGGSLDVGDILTLPSPPRWVVLSACDAGRTAPAARVIDVSLAHAFATAGAEAVVAPARPVKDIEAAALSTALYARASSNGWDLAEALREAQLTVQREAPTADWAAYRLVVR